MAVQSQTDQWKCVEDMGKSEQHNVTHRDLLPSYGWTDEWFTRIFLLSLPVRESRQEAAALRNFARWERRHGGQPQNA
jgi:hypothetical protein